VTPLVLAVAKGHATVTGVLINAGADIKVRDSRGNNCLHYACVQQNLKCVEILLNKNFEDLSEPNKDGLTP
jgi:ankyrin repeat protein